MSDYIPTHSRDLDLWIVQLDGLTKHALRIRDENVMKYKGKQLEAFEMGLNMQVLLMKAMMDDMLKEKEDVEV
tara:strand:+ start:346 stop:564 length:219 start_codon:yes stop_codon:yes gene_type:complete